MDIKQQLKNLLSKETQVFTSFDPHNTKKIGQKLKPNHKHRFAHKNRTETNRLLPNHNEFLRSFFF